jgi:hypothetical protein
MIYSMGSPCVPTIEWNACEPAITIVPSFRISGVLTIVFSSIVLIWSAALVQRRRGGLVLVLLCLPMLLVGGGVFPPAIGIIGGLVATRIYAPLTWWRARFSGRVGRFLAGLWPWALVLFLAWTGVGQWVAGYFFNDFMKANGWLVPVLVIGLLVAAVLAGFAYEVQQPAVTRRDDIPGAQTRRA